MISQEQLSAVKKEIIEKLDRVIFRQTCITCENFDHDTEICRLANQRPPAKIIVLGCDKWADDIPF